MPTRECRIYVETPLLKKFPETSINFQPFLSFPQFFFNKKHQVSLNQPKNIVKEKNLNKLLFSRPKKHLFMVIRQTVKYNTYL